MRQIEHRPLYTLQSDPRNPKAHDISAIEASVSRFGYVEPVVVDGRTGFIVSGHGRVTTLTAMEAAGDTPPDGVTVTEEGWTIPVVTGWESTDDAEAAGALIALNRTTELGGWVDDALLDLLDDLSKSPQGWEGVGFDQYDVDTITISDDDLKVDITPFDGPTPGKKTHVCPACGYEG